VQKLFAVATLSVVAKTDKLAAYVSAALVCTPLGDY
jgi:hypothetical protein